ncbi:MAG: type 4a pilus biogenesis protein PilO [Gammaproteobacteria bacterium]|jgi:type IV pilus assembly protein PilO|nr:type 4a pilus biogenesis protein PilO [Gammaproteobacteria bacterium]
MKISDLNQLDFNNVGKWPIPTKVAAIAIVCIIVLAAGFWFDTQEQIKVLGQAEEKESELKTTFEQKQNKAANLDVYRKQLVDIKKSFGAMLRQLPGKTEVEGLIDDVSQKGINSGLQFDLFKPEQESPVEFYAELPIKIRVAGNYNEFGDFVSGVAALPRIVTLHDISITPLSGNKDSKDKKDLKGSLVMEATAKTYRYLEEESK